jgi:uroporphyrinogen III methyltransferase / synthase
MNLNQLHQHGYVYIVGAGPGDPGLFSLKGKLVLELADVVLVDHLVHPSLLSFCLDQAEIIYVGKQRGKHSVTQDGINKYLKDFTDQNKVVVRLKGGDPFVFGRVGEEMQWLVKHNIAFEIIPGISSAVAGPGYFGIPVTHRDFSRSVGFVTGTLKKGKVPLEIPATDTIVFLMGYYGLDHLVDMLLKEKRFSKDTPIALISRATYADQDIISSTLDSICKLAKKSPLPTPVIVVVGKVVGLHTICDWVKTLPLFGKRVILCRQKSQYESWYNALQLAGSEVVYLPLIDTQLNQLDSIKLTKSLLDSITTLIFTSANAVTYFMETLNLNKLDIRSCAHIKLYSIGPTVTKALKNYALKPDVEAATNSVKGILEVLPTRLNSNHVLYLTSQLAANNLQQTCEKRGAIFTRLNIYKTQFKKIKLPELTSTDFILVTSPSVMDALLNLNSDIDKNTSLVVLGKTTKDYCESLGFNSINVAKEPTVDAVIDVLKVLEL